MRRYFALLAMCGGITLALEVLASRILTPYFGVSLYIWSAILSTTLLALACGYWLGGWISRRANVGGQTASQSLRFFLGLMPCIACFSMCLACLLYPKIFLPLANFHAVGGVIIASCILLIVPLLTMSSMNSLLIALCREERRDRTGRNAGSADDGGAGQVFFVSTLGSVGGVWLTALLLVPLLTNFRSMLVLALLSSLGAWLVIADGAVSGAIRGKLIRFALVTTVLAVGLQGAAGWYLQKRKIVTTEEAHWKLLEERPSFYGNVKVIERESKDGTWFGFLAPKLTIYSSDGLMQTLATPEGAAGGLYPYAVEILAKGVVPQPGNVLVLGMAGGVIPPRFAHCTGQLDVVDVEPTSRRLAEQYFHFQAGKAVFHNDDARRFLRNTATRYDLVIFDVFHGDGNVPEHLLTLEAMQSLASRLTESGVVVFNIGGRSTPGPGTALYCFLKTVRAAMPHIRLYSMGRSEKTQNLYLAASRRELPEFEADLRISTEGNREVLRRIFESPQAISERSLADSQLLTDEYNIYPVLHAREQQQFRRALLGTVPAPFFVN